MRELIIFFLHKTLAIIIALILVVVLYIIGLYIYNFFTDYLYHDWIHRKAAGLLLFIASLLVLSYCVNKIANYLMSLKRILK
ncbi:MAG TPA: hypothetical protein PKD00_01570 [Burkholderiales bacterium]|nr:hypothetical protein [Burkholderiales bacterium]